VEAGSTILEEDSLFTPLQVKSKGNCYPLITFKLSGPVSLDLAPNYFAARKSRQQAGRALPLAIRSTRVQQVD
jgi:hypothetical protein